MNVPRIELELRNEGTSEGSQNDRKIRNEYFATSGVSVCGSNASHICWISRFFISQEQ